MGLIPFQPARWTGNGPEVRQELPEASATISIGTPLQRDANPEYVEEHAGGATVTGIVGVAMATVAAGTPAFGTKIPMAVAGLGMEFLGQIWDVSESEVATPVLATHLGNDFGMVKISGNWYVDEEDTTNVVLIVTAIYPDIKAVLFKFIHSAIGD